MAKRSNTAGAADGLITEAPQYAPMSPAQIREELGLTVSQRGQPAFDQAVPKRHVSRQESKARGWSWYWDGSACRYSHQAARRTSNPGICSDCSRVSIGEPPVYGYSKAQTFYAERKPKDPVTGSPAAAAARAALPELTKAQLKFLELYHDTGSLAEAARGVGMTVARVESERLGVSAFDVACTKAGVPRHVPQAPAFSWGDAARELLVETYINTGSLSLARDAVKCTPAQYFAELETNGDFRESIERAKPFADQSVYDSLLRSALGGQQQALAKWLELQQAEAERTRGPVSPEQLDGELEAALKKLDQRGVLDWGACPQCHESLRPSAGDVIKAAPAIDEINADLTT
jgi:hypothetical protein